ncbi:GNAT family N-acetyltransferase [Virgibacillus proomii]|uniref:GNAT family N-acetyltransferase n=1 Tax=Virgibacillus proomii TaxID=84407 RepID=UPI001C119749|nr:GNAT family N-acetyltransferase [Virgibacillus proomii]MBU5268104.1 GNAT family N-acetyltransferase [Virgibacillus proomii]
MEWVVKSFRELEKDELFHLLKARIDVFVVEQQCAYPEIDEFDLQATHIFLQMNQKIAAYARILPPGSKYTEASIGRVMVVKGYRGKRYGRELMKQALSYVKKQRLGKIKIQAQQYLIHFYESFGFHQISPAYLDDGIWHIDMIWVKDHDRH